MKAEMVADKIKVADARADLRISQVALAKAARVSKQVIVNAEKGATIQRISARAIFNALNSIRQDYGLEPLKMDEIEWRVQGDED